MSPDWTGRVVACALACCFLSCERAPRNASGGVDRAVQYFVLRGQRTDPTAVLFLDFLRRKHDLTALVPVVERWKSPRIDPNHPDRQLELHLRTYARLVDPTARPSEEDIESLNNPLDRLGLEALYCDRRGHGADLIERLRMIATHGRYHLTHAALYASWAHENGCLEDAPTRALYAELAEPMKALIAGQADPTDVSMEALALLFHVGHARQVRPEWVQAVSRAQRKDGGWSQAIDVPESNDHSSVLGLWVLLESTRPNARPRAWLSR